MPNTILLNSVGTTFLKEAPCSSAGDGVITPGDFIERNAAGEFIRATINGNMVKLVALENDLISGEITDNYGTNARVRAAYVQPGDEVYAQVPANADPIVVGDKLRINAGGTVSKNPYGNQIDGSYAGAVTGAATNVSDIALSTGDAYTDGAVNTAVNAMVAEVNQQLLELETGSNHILPEFAEPVIATALEAVDNSGSPTKARIKIEIV